MFHYNQGYDYFTQCNLNVVFVSIFIGSDIFSVFPIPVSQREGKIQQQSAAYV